MQFLQRSGNMTAAAKDKNRRLEEASRVEAYVHPKKETRLANSVTDADAKRDQAMKRAAAAETSMRSEVAQANNAEKRARREASISEVEKNFGGGKEWALTMQDLEDMKQQAARDQKHKQKRAYSNAMDLTLASKLYV